MKMKLLTESAKLPTRGDEGAAGFDMYASADICISPWSRALIPTGVAMQIPPSHYGRIAPRSSMAVKGYDIGAGVIDSSYRGEIKVLLINSTDKEVKITTHDRVAQIIFEQCFVFDLCVSESLEDSSRGSNGFGSTGK